MDGNAIVYCQGSFNTPNGKTAHGLVRFTRRYRVLSVVDSRYAGNDAAEVLDGSSKGIPVVGDIKEAVSLSGGGGNPATHLVVGLAPDGGRLGPSERDDVMGAIRLGLNIDCGLHDFLSEDPEISQLAGEHGVSLRDVRKPPPRGELHFFSGKIEKVTSFKVAVLGTDSAVGKRTTAWMLVDALQRSGRSVEMVGTGQTSWMQGAKYVTVMDAIVNDFISGEIEHVVFRAWDEARPDVIVIEGQGSLMNPAYPGGYEILAAARPDAVVLQHAPARAEYDGFPGYPIHPINDQIRAIELISGKRVVAVTVNHENIGRKDVPAACDKIGEETGLPAFDVLLDGADGLAELLIKQAEGSRP
jgi:uncharacterized NAD-dependent epimerase/dehydratase family protein